VLAGQFASALPRAGLHLSSTCTARSRCFRSQSSICRAGVEDKSPEPAFSTVATISLRGSGGTGFVQAAPIKQSPEHRVIPVRCRDVIVNSNPDRISAYPTLQGYM